MRTKKYIAIVAAFAMIISMEGCGKGGDTESASTASDSAKAQEAAVETSSEATEEQAAETAYTTDGEVQSEYMDPVAIEGSYGDKISQRATMDITYNTNTGYYEIIIRWGSSATQSTQWAMTARDKGNTRALTYEDCSCDNMTYGNDGSFKSENVYQGGKGELTVNDDMTITWYDNKKAEHIFEKM